MVEWVKDPMLSLLCLGLDPWPKNFRMSQAEPGKKKKKRPGQLFHRVFCNVDLPGHFPMIQFR